MAKVRHWKHGWIPVSPEAKAFMAGRGPKPGSGDVGPVPNAKRGMPVASLNAYTKAQADAEDRAAELNALAGTNARPHFQFASQDVPAHYSGGVIIGADDADRMIRDRIFGDQAEGGLSAMALRQTGRDLPANWNRGKPDEMARRRIRMLGDKLDIDTDGIYPEWEPQGNGEGIYTGGMVIYPSAADRMIKSLNNTYTGPLTQWQMDREAGLRNDGRGRSAQDTEAWARRMAAVINARHGGH